jgi:hypothetical protein
VKLVFSKLHEGDDSMFDNSAPKKPKKYQEMTQIGTTSPEDKENDIEYSVLQRLKMQEGQIVKVGAGGENVTVPHESQISEARKQIEHLTRGEQIKKLLQQLPERFVNRIHELPDHITCELSRSQVLTMLQDAISFYKKLEGYMMKQMKLANPDVRDLEVFRGKVDMNYEYQLHQALNEYIDDVNRQASNQLDNVNSTQTRTCRAELPTFGTYLKVIEGKGGAGEWAFYRWHRDRSGYFSHPRCNEWWTIGRDGRMHQVTFYSDNSGNWYEHRTGLTYDMALTELPPPRSRDGFTIRQLYGHALDTSSRIVRQFSDLETVLDEITSSPDKRCIWISDIITYFGLINNSIGHMENKINAMNELRGYHYEYDSHDDARRLRKLVRDYRDKCKRYYELAFPTRCATREAHQEREV